MSWASFRRKHIWLFLDEKVSGDYEARHPYKLRVWYHEKDGFLQMHEELFDEDSITDLRRTSQDDFIVVRTAKSRADSMTRNVSRNGLPLTVTDDRGRKHTTTYPSHRIVKFEVFPAHE